MNTYLKLPNFIASKRPIIFDILKIYKNKQYIIKALYFINWQN